MYHLTTGPTDLTAADRGLIATDVKPVLLAQVCRAMNETHACDA
jgi:hypothetical protein